MSQKWGNWRQPQNESLAISLWAKSVQLISRPEPPAQWNTDGKSKETQKHRWNDTERIKRRNEESWKTILDSSDYFCCINKIAIIRATVAVICCPIVALLRKSGNTSFPLCNPIAGCFIRKYFYQDLAEIFLGRKLVKALISSEDNQTLGYFHLKGKSRRTNFMRNKSRQKITKAEPQAPIIWKAEMFLKKNRPQKRGKNNGNWKVEFASWKQNVISWGGGWIRKVAFPLQKLRITRYYRQQRPTSAAGEEKTASPDFNFTLNPNFQHQECNISWLALTESWKRNSLTVTPVRVLLGHFQPPALVLRSSSE